VTLSARLGCLHHVDFIYGLLFDEFMGLNLASSLCLVHAGSRISHHSQTEQSSRAYGYGEGVDVRAEGSDLEQTLLMVASGIVGNQNRMAKVSPLTALQTFSFYMLCCLYIHCLPVIRSMPSSENFTQCINLSKHRKSKNPNRTSMCMSMPFFWFSFLLSPQCKLQRYEVNTSYFLGLNSSLLVNASSNSPSLFPWKGWMKRRMVISS